MEERNEERKKELTFIKMGEMFEKTRSIKKFR
jgi:hypothetical protein